MKNTIVKLLPPLSPQCRCKEMSRRRRIDLLLLMAGFCCAVPSARSQPAAFFGQYTLGGGWDGADQVQGWEFIPHADLTVLKLGLYDGRLTGGFQQAHEVAIWDGNGALITSAAIGLGESAPLYSNFRYVDIPSITLHQGQTYVIGAFLPAPVTDYTVLWERPALTNGIVGFDPRIEFVAYRAGPSPGSISFPEGRWVDYIGGFGPNFIIAVPEPSAFELLPIMVGASALMARRRRRSENST